MGPSLGGGNREESRGRERADCFEVNADKKSFKIQFQGDTLEIRHQETDWVVVGKYREYEQQTRSSLSKLREDNPGQPALLVHALVAAGEPTRPLHKITANEDTAIRAAIDQYLTRNRDPNSAEFSLLSGASKALDSIRHAPEFSASVKIQESAERTKGLAHPLHGDCVVHFRVAGETRFKFEFANGKLQGLDELPAADRYLRLLSVEQSNVLPAEMKQYLLNELRPQVKIGKTGDQILVSMAVSEKDSLKVWSSDVALGEVRYSVTNGQLTVRQGEKGAWSAALSPSEILLTLAALEGRFPEEAQALKKILFLKYDDRKGEGHFYGHFSGACDNIGVFVTHSPPYGDPKTDFQAKGKGALRWDDTDGGAAFSVRAIIETCKSRREDYREPLKAVLDHGEARVHDRENLTLRDMRGEGEHSTAQYSESTGVVRSWYRGYYAPSGFAYEKEGWRPPDASLFCALLEARKLLPGDNSEAAYLSSSAVIVLKNDEEVLALQHSGQPHDLAKPLTE